MRALGIVLILGLVSICYSQSDLENDLYQKGIEVEMANSNLIVIFDTMDDLNNHDFTFYSLKYISLNGEILLEKIKNMIDIVRINNIIEQSNDNFNEYIKWRFDKIHKDFDYQVDWFKKTKEYMDEQKKYSISNQILKLIEIAESLKLTSYKISLNGLSN